MPHGSWRSQRWGGAAEEKQRRAAQHELAQRHRLELMQDPDPANVAPREEDAVDDEGPAS
ncbi:hypothetical protein [Streptomyces canus]|uniref:hypothetical protein n=1 Tax=Streptomyces canus TaxID=58343 RepID=UPI002DDAA38D|nr:hypothetical protein [Streptomyces canus]WSD82957.1 hypothetical protein OG925_00650 [Streptomyces canus]WSD91878.1 hypothetical protein OG925_49830 [Streptomyces canus]WSD92633.1 hypothetical protein OG925_51130 [Streptomyces canus]